MPKIHIGKKTEFSEMVLGTLDVYIKKNKTIFWYLTLYKTPNESRTST